MSTDPRHNGTRVGALAALGLSEQAERLYRQILGHQGESLAMISRSVEMPARRVRELLVTLEDLGLVTRTLTRPPRYLPNAPESAVEHLILRRQQEVLDLQRGLEDARAAARELEETFGHGVEARADQDLVQVISGERAVLQLIRDEMAGAQREIVGLGRSPVGVPQPHLVDLKRELLGRGVRCRGVYDVAALSSPEFVSFLETVGSAGEESRIVPELPMRLLVVDGVVAMTPLQVDRWDEWLLVRSGSLVQAFMAFFESVWGQAAAIPLPDQRDDAGADGAPAEPAGVSVDEQRLLVLLSMGKREEDIASEFGLVVRTIERRVSRLLQENGLRSRFQLGLLTAQRGWLSPGLISAATVAPATRPVSRPARRLPSTRTATSVRQSAASS